MQHRIYMALHGEGTSVWRPVQAAHLGDDLFRVLGIVPAGEEWAFQPGEIVHCQEQQLSHGPCLVAVRRAANVA